MKLYLLILGLGLMPSAFGQAASSANLLNFHQALEAALDHSAEYQTLKLRRENARLEAKNAWATLLPAFDLQATHTYAQQNSTAYVLPSYRHAPWSNQAGLTISENLYDNGVSYRQARAAELADELQELALESGRARLLINVAKAYYDFSLAVATLELQRQQIQTLNTQFRAIESRYRQGLSSNRDYLRIKAQGQSSEIGRVSQELHVAEVKKALRLWIGVDEGTEFVPYEVSPEVVRRLQDQEKPVSEINLENTYEFRSATLSERISEITRTSARRAEWPRVSVQGSYNYTVPQYLGEKIPEIDAPYWNLQVMLVVDYRLWDWGKKERTVKVAENLTEIEMQTQRLNRLKVREDLQELGARVALLKQSYHLSQQILTANQDVYDSLNRGYREGKISYLDLITALNNVYGSRTQDLALKFDILKSRLDEAYYRGTVDDTLKTQ